MFNTKFDVGEAIGITRQHRVLMESHGTRNIKKFDDLSSDEKPEARKDTEERYPSYIFLWISGKQHNKLKVYLKNYFTTGDEWYPKNIQANLMVIEKYTNYSVIQQNNP